MKRFFLLLLCLMLLSGCTPQPVTKESYALDTYITVTVYSGDSSAAEAALSRIDACERILSAHIESSDVGRLNASDGKTAVTVDPLTAKVLASALSVGIASDGALDITLLPVSSLWDYKSADPTVPSEESVTEALSHKGMENIVISGNSVISGGAQIDLGAVAKGAIGDEARQTLSDAGISSALLNLGGNIITLGEKPDKSPWVIAIDDPGGDGTIGKLTFSGSMAVATSSGSQRYFVKDGIAYHHILNPETGYPARSGLSSVTVLAPDGLTADALSTALFVAGEEKATQILTNYPGVSAVLLRDDDTVALLGDPPFTPSK